MASCPAHSRASRPPPRHRTAALRATGPAHRRQRRAAPCHQGHGARRGGLRARFHLAASANLVIVGGDLEHPGAAEAAELARIHALMEAHRDLRDRVVLLGHRPHADASLVLAAARFGWGRGIAPCGAYVCGSLKEEFGLAIVEAMAAGLPVVAPVHGGPASYVEPGRTGALVDTTDAAAIAVGVREALAMARDPRLRRGAARWWSGVSRSTGWPVRSPPSIAGRLASARWPCPWRKARRRDTARHQP